MILEDVTRHESPRPLARELPPRPNFSREPIPLDVLKEISLLEDLPDEDLRDIAAVLRPTTVTEGSYVFQEGDRGDSVFLIVNGVLEVIAHTSSSEFVINNLRAGDFFGEMAVVDGQPRAASVRAETTASLLELRQDDFFEIFSKNCRP